MAQVSLPATRDAAGATPDPPLRSPTRHRATAAAAVAAAALAAVSTAQPTAAGQAAAAPPGGSIQLIGMLGGRREPTLVVTGDGTPSHSPFASPRPSPRPKAKLQSYVARTATRSSTNPESGTAAAAAPAAGAAAAAQEAVAELKVVNSASLSLASEAKMSIVRAPPAMGPTLSAGPVGSAAAGWRLARRRREFASAMLALPGLQVPEGDPFIRQRSAPDETTQPPSPRRRGQTEEDGGMAQPPSPRRRHPPAEEAAGEVPGPREDTSSPPLPEPKSPRREPGARPSPRRRAAERREKDAAAPPLLGVHAAPAADAAHPPLEALPLPVVRQPGSPSKLDLAVEQVELDLQASFQPGTEPNSFDSPPATPGGPPPPPHQPRPPRHFVRGARTAAQPALDTAAPPVDLEVQPAALDKKRRPRHKSADPGGSEFGKRWCDTGDLMDVARDLGARVVSPQEEGEDEDCRVQESATAILLPADPARLDEAAACLRRLAARRVEPRTTPVVAVLMRQTVATEEALEAYVRAQRELCAGGADDVILAAESRMSLKVDIAMSMVRQEVHLLAVRGAEQRGEREVERCAAEERKKRVEPKAGLFWQNVHRLFESLPMLETELPAVVKEGVWVGPSELGAVLGEGGFGQVWSATNADLGEPEAVKCIDKDSLGSLEDLRSLSTEVDTLQRLCHPNIVGFRGVAHGPEHMFVRMELAGRYSMWHAMRFSGGRFRQEVAQRFTHQVMSAVAHCYASGVAHRDLKPENVAISDDGLDATLIDFGSAAALDEPCYDMAGTMPFMAPEVMAAENAVAYQPDGVDVWSAGVVLLEMLCGYGKLNKMLGWNDAPAPQRARQAELQAFFADTRGLEAALQADLGAVAPGLLALLAGMLQVDRHLRATAKASLLGDWLREPWRPGASA